MQNQDPNPGQGQDLPRPRTEAEAVAQILINDATFYSGTAVPAMWTAARINTGDAGDNFTALVATMYQQATLRGRREGLTNADGGLLALAFELARHYSEFFEWLTGAPCREGGR